MTHTAPTTPTETKPTKAIVGAVAAGVVAVIGGLVAGLSDGVLSPAEILIAVSAGIVASGLTGGTVFNTTNDPK